MNCKCVLSVIVLGIAALLTAGPVNVQLRKGAIYRPDTKLFWRNMTFSNGLGRYQINLSVSKPVGNKAQAATMGFAGGGFGFCDLAAAFELTVNGISFRKLNYTAENMSLWSNGDEKGVEIKMNFDGAKVVARFYMRPDSGVLWCRLYRAADSVEPINKVRFSATCIPSNLAKKNGKVQFHNIYGRQVKTPLKTYKARHPHQKISPLESSFIFYDSMYDGSPFKPTKNKLENEKNDKGFGPCMFISDHKNMKKGEIIVRNDWTNTIILEFGNDFKEYNFGYYNSPVRTKNDAFFKRVADKPAAFTFKKK